MTLSAIPAQSLIPRRPEWAMEESMTKLLTALVVALGLSMSAAYAQQDQLKCTDVTQSVKPMDGGFKRIGIRAPKATAANGQRVTLMGVQVKMPVANARTDASLEQPKITKVFDCEGEQIGYMTRVEQLPDHDATEIVVPETFAKGTKIMVCSKSYNGCAIGEFDSFDKWVNLTVRGVASTTKISGKYN